MNISYPDGTSDVSFIQDPSLGRYNESDPIGLDRGIDPSGKPMTSGPLICFCEDNSDPPKSHWRIKNGPFYYSLLI